jgi:hypothetical protein
MAKKNLKEHLEALKIDLQKGTPKALEQLAADLITKLVGVRMTVAKSGFQHGSDAGTSGRAGRHLRLECKRYADNSPLDERNLQGEVDDALKRDHALEAWILVSTRDVPQQTEDTLQGKVLTTGVPVIVIDWRDDSAELPSLAALCAWAPEVVEKHYGEVTMKSAKALTVLAGPIVDRLTRELSPWAIGYERLLDLAIGRLERLWGDAAESRSIFGQNVAVGTIPVIERQSISRGLESWWQSDTGSTAVVHGDEGMGKTWAALQWVQGRLANLPIFLMLPSSAFKEMKGISHASIAEFLGNALHDLTPGTARSYWASRVARLLDRPAVEGAALLLLVDGINQEQSFEWERLLQFLEVAALKGRIRVIVTVQTRFLKERLHELRRLSYPATRLEVGRYDLSQGGEFDTLLGLHGLKRTDLSSGVIELARVPRLFELTIRLKADADLQGEPTASRLLWVHAKDELGIKPMGAMSELEWEEWLQEVAVRYRREIELGENGYSSRELADMVRDPAGSSDQTARRLDEIVSGNWLEPISGRPGRLRPTEATINLALGIAVLGALESAETESPEKAARVLDEYLDPVMATPAAAEILASALSVLVEKNLLPHSVVPRLVLAALLRSQNANDEQRQDAVRLAPALIRPLLDVVEDAGGRANASARHWALVALHEVSALNTSAWEDIADRLVGWVAVADCPAPAKVAANDEAAVHQAKSLTAKIGTAMPGVHLVLGVPVRLQEDAHDNLQSYVPQLLLGKPLFAARKVLVAATVASVVAANAGRDWSGLKWLVALNAVDHNACQTDLARLSAFATKICREPGIPPGFARRVSNMLLWLTGDEDLERKAAEQHVLEPGNLTYSKDYLTIPARSFYALEHRHISFLWSEKKMSAFAKLQRSKAFLSDPALTFPKHLAAEVNVWGQSFKVENLSGGRSSTSEDQNFDIFISLTARVSPQAIANLVARWFRTFSGRSDERREWAARKAPRFALLALPPDIASIRDMRLGRPVSATEDERMTLLCILQCELMTAPLDVQLDILVTEPGAFISVTLADTLRAPEVNTIARFVHRWGLENARAVEVLCIYLWRYPVSLDNELFNRLLHHALSEGDGHQTLAFMALSSCNRERFGRELLEAGWKPLPAANEYMQHLGSQAILAASSETKLAKLFGSVASWCLLDEAVRRGGDFDDLRIAVQAIDAALSWESLTGVPAVARISVESRGSRNLISVEPNLKNSDDEDGFESFDPDVRWAQHQAARETGETYLRNAKSAGAVMATRVISLDTARMLVKQCPVVISRWLESLDEPTQALIARINLAGGLFLALCEALLESEPSRGAQLWHVLKQHLRIRFIGIGELDELLLMLFRVPDSPAVLELREQIYRLSQNLNDESYLDLVLAAISQGGGAWLESALADDEAASEPFRQKRAITLRGFLPTEPSFRPIWHEGEINGSWDALRIRSQETRNRASQARHWWTAFLTATDVISAYCAWQTFLTCADKMAWRWIDTDIEHHRQGNELWRLKMLHLGFNESVLKAALGEKSKKGPNPRNRYLTGWDSPEGWFAQGVLASLQY